MTVHASISSPSEKSPIAVNTATSAIRAGRAVWLILHEARWTVQGMYALRFTAGTLLANPSGFTEWHTFAGLVSWICVCVVIYALNGVSDVRGDRCNGSSRPIATGALPVDTAWRVIVCMTVAGLVTASAVSAKMALAYVLMFMVGWAYSFGARPLKNSLAGLVVAGTSLGTLTYLAGWLAVRGETLTAELVVFAVGMSLWMGLVGSATKDLKDVAGDRVAGRRTLPILLGRHRAMLAAAAVATVVGVTFPLVVSAVAPTLTAASLCVLAGSAVLAAVLGRARRTAGDFGGRAYHVFMITQYVVNLISLT